MTTQQIAGYKAAHTRKVKRLTEAAANGEMTTQQAAGHKAVSKRRLNALLNTK